MGYAHQHHIEHAGQYLLAKLATKNPINYSEIYNEQTTAELDAIGERIGVMSFPSHIDWAVMQLVDQRIVSRRNLPDAPKLIDDEGDFEITLKKPDAKPHYQGMDL